MNIWQNLDLGLSTCSGDSPFSSPDYTVAPDRNALHPVPFNPQVCRFLLQFPFFIFTHKKPSNLQRSFLIPLLLNRRYTLANSIWRGRQPPCLRKEPRASGAISGLPESSKELSQTLVDPCVHSVGTGHRGQVISTENQGQDPTEKCFCSYLVPFLLPKEKNKLLLIPTNVFSCLA